MSQRSILWTAATVSSLFVFRGLSFGTGLLSTATVTAVGPFCNVTISQTGTSSVTDSLPACNGEAAVASASTSFNAASPNLSTLSVTDSASGPEGPSAKSTASFDYLLYVTGGSGPGFFNLSFVHSDAGDSLGMSGGNVVLSASLNGTSYSNSVLCAAGAGSGFVTCSGSVPIGFKFNYGVPFELNVALNGEFGGIDGAFIRSSGNFTYSIFTSGEPNPSASLRLIPEPSSASLTLAGTVPLLALGLRYLCCTFRAGKPLRSAT